MRLNLLQAALQTDKIKAVASCNWNKGSPYVVGDPSGETVILDYEHSQSTDMCLAGYTEAPDFIEDFYTTPAVAPTT